MREGYIMATSLMTGLLFGTIIMLFFIPDPGIYIMHIIIGNQQFVEKLVVQD